MSKGEREYKVGVQIVYESMDPMGEQINRREWIDKVNRVLLSKR